jgi:hypothetical protein
MRFSKLDLRGTRINDLRCRAFRFDVIAKIRLSSAKEFKISCPDV